MPLAREQRHAHHSEHSEAEEDKHDAAEPRQNVAPRTDKDAQQSRRSAEQYKDNGEAEDKRERVFKYNHARTALGGGVLKRRERNTCDKCQIPRHYGERAGGQKHKHPRHKRPGKQRYIHLIILLYSFYSFPFLHLYSPTGNYWCKRLITDSEMTFKMNIVFYGVNN